MQHRVMSNAKTYTPTDYDSLPKSIDTSDVEDFGCIDEIELGEGGDYIDVVMRCTDGDKVILVTINVDIAKQLLAELPALVEHAEPGIERLNQMFQPEGTPGEKGGLNDLFKPTVKPRRRRAAAKKQKQVSAEKPRTLDDLFN
jgi:hypothetical protein